MVQSVVSIIYLVNYGRSLREISVYLFLLAVLVERMRYKVWLVFVSGF